MKISLSGRIDMMQNTESNMYVMSCNTIKISLTLFTNDGSYLMNSNIKILNKDVTVWVKIRYKITLRARLLFFISHFILHARCWEHSGTDLSLLSLVCLYKNSMCPGWLRLRSYITKNHMKNSTSIKSVTTNMDEPNTLKSGREWINSS